MKRRTFLSTLAAAGAGIALPATARAESVGTTAALRGFIVSDAHIGWDNDQQPSLEAQRTAMAKIMGRFPDLDLFIDSGDAHHNGPERDVERGQWTELIPGGCGTLPFFYTTGNHEVISGREDRESMVAAMGSLNARPYYSYDLHGIHFVSLPQMVRAVYTTRESLEWLALDLAANRNTTTVIISHNNIRGTTGPWHPGYRGVVNSDALLAVFEANPQVIAWMHGHNHNYQVVPAHGMLFVSNGRIGGFDPSRHEEDGPYGLGGIYFEIGEDGLSVRCYSTEWDTFLDERGVKESEGRVERATSFAPGAPAAVSCGFGGARDGQKIPVYNHYAGAGETALFVKSLAEADFNDDPDINLYMARKGVQDQFMGLSVGVSNERHDWDNGRLVIHAKSAGETVNVSVPRRGFHEHMYYRAAPGRAYTAEVAFEPGNEGVTVQARLELHGAGGRKLAAVPLADWALDAGRSVRSATAEVPALDDSDTLYGDGDAPVLLSLQLDITGMTEDLAIDRIRLQLAGAEGITRSPVVVVGETRHGFGESAAGRGFAETPIEPVAQHDAVVGVEAGGSGRFSWMIRRKGIDWQVRNATVADRGDHLEVGPMRNRWMQRPAVVIAPIYRTGAPFVHRLERIEHARVYPLNRGNARLRVDVEDAAGDASVVVAAPRRPASVSGGGDWTYGEGRVRIAVQSGARVEIDFA